MPPKLYSRRLENKLKLIKTIMGNRVIFSIGIRENNKIDILKAERICYCAKVPEEFIEEDVYEGPNNGEMEKHALKEDQIRNYMG